MWIWQQPDWPGRKQKTLQVFRYDHATLTPKLRELHFLQGVLLGKMGVQDNQQAALDTMLANILTSSAIEGERLNHSVVRSSLARKLGIAEQKSVSGRFSAICGCLRHSSGCRNGHAVPAA